MYDHIKFYHIISMHMHFYDIILISYINIRTEYDTCQLNYMGIKYMMCVSILLFKISSITSREYIYEEEVKI